jgi:pectate lyase C
MKSPIKKITAVAATMFAVASLQAATVTLTDTYVIPAGATYDGNGNTIKASGMGDGGQGEGQKAFFRLNANSTLREVILSAPGVDGCHFYGTGWMRYVTWQDVGEDAWTVKSGGHTHVDNSSMYKAYDKAGQVNAASTCDLYYTNTDDTGKVIRQLGGSTFTCNFYYYPGTHNRCHEAIGRTDSSSTRFWYRNITVQNFTGSQGWWYGRSSQASTF